jgi:hypothetical protein
LAGQAHLELRFLEWNLGLNCEVFPKATPFCIVVLLLPGRSIPPRPCIVDS